MATIHGYCSRHRIAYNRDLDPTCPQCTLAGLEAPQYDFTPPVPQPQLLTHTITDPTTGATLDPVTLEPVR